MSFYVYQSVYIAFIGMALACMSNSWTSGMLNLFNSTSADNPLGRNITTTEYDWMTSLPTLGSGAGALIYGFLTSRFGRKPLMITTGVPILIFYLTMAFATEIYLFFISRFAVGLSTGGAFTLCPIYSGEVAEAKNRGNLGTAFAILVNVGLLIPLVLMPHMSWTLFHVVVGALAVAYMVSAFFLIAETPYYLMKRDEDAARDVLIRLRGRQNVDEEIDEIKAAVSMTGKSFKEVITSKATLKPLLLGYVGYVFLVLTGIMIVTSHAQKICDLSNNDFAHDHGPLLISITQLVVVFFVSFIADSFPRKLLLIVSYLGSAIVLIPFGLYFVLRDNGTDLEDYSWLPLLCLVLFVVVYNMGVGTLFTTILGELFPSDTKGVAISILIVANWLHSFLMTQFFDPVEEAIGLGALFWIFAGSSVLGAGFVHFFMVETQGKTLQEIQEDLK